MKLPKRKKIAYTGSGATPGTVIGNITVCGVHHCGREINASSHNLVDYEWYAYQWDENRWYGPYAAGLYHCGSHQPRTDAQIRADYGEPA